MDPKELVVIFLIIISSILHITYVFILANIVHFIVRRILSQFKL